MNETHKSSTAIETLLNTLIVGLSLLMVAYHLISTQTLLVDPQRHQVIHLAFAFTLVLLVAITWLRTRLFQSLFLLVLLISGLLAMAYVFFNASDLEFRIGFLETPDIIFGVILVIAVLEACRKAWGLIFPTLALMGILYAALGHFIPQPIGHKAIPLELVLSYLGIGMQGIYGPILYASANMIFPFVVFASLLKGVGGVQFFSELGKLGGKVLSGGPAQTAVISSALVGMCTGAAAANVAITGSFTIPHMKKSGYKPEMAAGIEATASTGGQITPPVMGAAAFLMASFLGISFVDIMTMAIIPTVIFYFAVGLGVEMRAIHRGLTSDDEPIDLKLMLQTSLVFVAPIGLLIALLVMRYTPMFAAFWSTVCLLVVSLVQKRTRPTIRSLVVSLRDGALAGSEIAVGCAAIGMFAQILTFTGLGIKIAGLVDVLAGGSLAIAAVLTALLSILLGCGLPTVAAYVIAGTVAAPVLVNMGVLPAAAHMFIFYFGVFAAITPPVAGACMVASRLAQADYLKTCLEAMKLSLAAYILPFVMLTTPLILLRPQNDLVVEWIAAGCMILAIFMLVFASQKQFFKNLLTNWERGACVLIGGLLLIYALARSNIALVLGAILFFVFLGMQITKKKRVLARAISIETGRETLP